LSCTGEPPVIVKINRTALPPEIAIKKEDNYRSGPVYDLLKKDFFGKCYLCEDDEPTGIQIEHRHSHKGDAVLKFDWNNLFYSCYHCNHAKQGHYDDVIDCTQVDPQDYFALELKVGLKTEIKITKLNDTTGVDQTIALLNHIFNGNTKPILSDECVNLRKKICFAIIDFQSKLDNYLNESDKDLKAACANVIRSCISRGTAFAAFKRDIIKNNAILSAEFGSAL
jgi:hypothetical protein